MSASPAHRHKYFNRVVHTPSDEIDDAASAGEVAAHDATADSNSPSTSSCGGDLSQGNFFLLLILYFSGNEAKDA